MTNITIPPAALEAAVKAYFATKEDTYEGWIKDACLAMLKAWPGMLRIDGYEYGVQDVIHLPLTETPDD